MPRCLLLIMKGLFNDSLRRGLGWQASRRHPEARLRRVRAALALGSRAADPLLRQGLVLHASGLEVVRPLAACAGMAVLEVLTEVVGAEELLGLVALAEFVNHVEMLCSHVPSSTYHMIVYTTTTHPTSVLGSQFFFSFGLVVSLPPPRMLLAAAVISPPFPPLLGILKRKRLGLARPVSES